ncbi:pentapeptide repeat-containing protein [Actinokineospora sp. NPDC004072]
MCGYLRLPYAVPEESAKPWEAKEELQVRLTAQRIIAHHLRPRSEPVAGTYWPDVDLDLTGAVLVEFNLTNAHLRSLRAAGAVFIGATWLNGLRFDANARFEGAEFRGPVRFDGSTFAGVAHFAHTRFAARTRFTDGRFEHRTSFADAEFEGPVSTARAVFAQPPVLDGTEFRHGNPFTQSDDEAHTPPSSP